MKEILILNASPRSGTQSVNIEIPRSDYKIIVEGYSKCDLIQDYLEKKLENTNRSDTIVIKKKSLSIFGNRIEEVRHCTACYGCIKNGNCIKNDNITLNILPALETSNILIIVSPLYYGTIPSQLLAFFDRLYPYWIRSKSIDPKKGYPNEYPKPHVFTIGTCADPWQDWSLFDLTIKKIYTEIGWSNTNVVHLPNYSGSDDEKSIIDEKVIDNIFKFYI